MSMSGLLKSMPQVKTTSCVPHFVARHGLEATVPSELHVGLNSAVHRHGEGATRSKTNLDCDEMKCNAIDSFIDSFIYINLSSPPSYL